MLPLLVFEMCLGNGRGFGVRNERVAKCHSIVLLLVHKIFGLLCAGVLEFYIEFNRQKGFDLFFKIKLNANMNYNYLKRIFELLSEIYTENKLCLAGA